MQRHPKLSFALCVLIVTVISAVQLTVTAQSDTSIIQTIFSHDEHYLVIELLDDDLAHFEFGIGSPREGAIWMSPMIAKTDYAGVSSFNQVAPTILETSEIRLEIDESTLCVAITDISRDPELLLSTTCPNISVEDEESILSLTQEHITDAYGLGEQFTNPADTNGNWIGKLRSVIAPYGNTLQAYNSGNVGNATFPILYALGEGTDNYALFLDDVYRQSWDFRNDPFLITTANTVLRWFIMTGSDLPDLRHDYMELTGHPPVPPRQMFGLWVSEYGYENWDELTAIVDSLLEQNFPLDGMVLDLQWFGGIGANSQMGSLTWDEENFPDPSSFIAMLQDEYGIRVMPIEESYVAESAENYEESAAADVLVRACADCEPVSFVSWWGTGSMVDWTNPEAAAWWHDNRRQPLIDDGVIAHWTDLGEPEDYDENAWYYGIPELDLHSHADIHNLYNFFWSQSIFDAYQAHNLQNRPFIMTRSGTSGVQRFGVGMWSGDIGANMRSLQTQMNVQMQMSLSGIDYFGSDIGGFLQGSGDRVYSRGELYSIWLANSVLLDVPVRPHTSNLQNIYETAPSLIGDTASNLANVRLRYALMPYLYTLAHQAYRHADPIFAPLVYYFQDDPVVRTIGNQKMIGAELMMVTLTDDLIEDVAVYLPAGGWFNYYTHEYYESSGEWISVPSMLDGIWRAPLFVRDGAIIPQMIVQEQTMNSFGRGVDGTVNQDLVLEIFAANADDGTFTLIEDDGETIAYQEGAVQEITIAYARQGNGWMIEIAAAIGTYDAAPTQRHIEVHLITPNADMLITSDVYTVNLPLEIAFP